MSKIIFSFALFLFLIYFSIYSKQIENSTQHNYVLLKKHVLQKSNCTKNDYHTEEVRNTSLSFQ